MPAGTPGLPAPRRIDVREVSSWILQKIFGFSARDPYYADNTPVSIGCSGSAASSSTCFCARPSRGSVFARLCCPMLFALLRHVPAHGLRACAPSSIATSTRNTPPPFTSPRSPREMAARIKGSCSHAHAGACCAAPMPDTTPGIPRWKIGNANRSKEAQIA
jgi:hypothetical protein